MSDVTLITCTNTKRDTPAPARDLYDESRYFRAMREWAESRGDPWRILSAKHGLVHPDTVLKPYNERGFSEEQARETAAELSVAGFDTVHVTGGRDYTDELVPELESRGIDAVNHFAGERIGTRQKLLRKAANDS